MPKQPNILFVFTDQQTLRAMSACGNPHLKTPHMDAIASSGVRFERSYCASPVCWPSLASLMTGRMPHDVGVNGPFNDPLDSTVHTMGDIFREAGYETAYTGKWHLPTVYHWGDQDVDQHGFRFMAYPRTDQNGKGTACDPPATDQAIRFIRQTHDRPFLLVVSYHNPHDICGYVSRGRHPIGDLDRLPPLPRNFPRDPDEPQFITECRQRRYYGNEANGTVDWSTEDWRNYLGAYYRFVEQVDVEVGRVMQALRDAGLERDTLVIFTSDHGEGVGGHQWVVKLMLYEEPVSVPLIVSWPGVVPQGVTDATHLTSGVDLLPTLCDYAGVAIPAGLAGVSLRPVIEQPASAGRAYVVSELQPDTKDPSKLGRMIRTSQYKYIAFSYGRNPEMLFDLVNDPGEIQDLARQPQSQPTLQEHRKILRDWVAATNDRFPTLGMG